MMCNNPKLDLVNVDGHRKIGQIMSICSQGTEGTRNSGVNQGPKLCQKFAKNDRQQSQAKILSMLMCIQILVRFCQFIHKILSGNKILTSIKGNNSVKILREKAGNNLKARSSQC